MRSLVPALLLVTLGCSGREPPALSRFDASGFFVDAANASADGFSPQDVARDVAMIPTGAQVPEFMLPDLNPMSRTHQMTISPTSLRPRLGVFYFSNAI